MSARRYGVVQERDWNALSDDEFRGLVRAEVQANYPEHLRYRPGRLMWADQSEWVLRLVRRGWIAPGWPCVFGGMGLSPAKQIIYVEEFERWGVGRYVDHGVLQVGPVIMRYGTREQQDTWLPPILEVEHRWAQGYSESEAGSDLASLRTRARRDGDEYLLDGQKIWTTQAHDATHIYVLARTNPEVKKQAGISFFLVDLASPGITVRQIRDIAGHGELCEVFFDSVRVPFDHLVGEENQGWTVAKSLLGHERINLGSPKLPEYGLSALQRVARASGALDDPVFRDRVATAQLDVAHLGDAYAKYTAHVARGESLGPDVSMLKIWATETFCRIADLIIEAAGDAGGLAGEQVALGAEIHDVLGAFYKARPSTIYGGSNEIQRNIIATAVLGLPRGRTGS
jgi:alkylation response protein AidB-like acyl-CoA dehydrogenase